MRLSNIYPNSDHLDLLGLGTAEDTLWWSNLRVFRTFGAKDKKVVNLRYASFNFIG
jgi:hypothetical protein